MASVGGSAVDTFKGRIPYAVPKAAVIEAPPGLDGIGVVFGGYTEQVATARTSREAVDDTAADTLVGIYRAMQKTSVTVVDGYGDSWTCTVLRVNVAKSDTIFGTVRVDAEWVLVPDVGAP